MKLPTFLVREKFGRIHFSEHRIGLENIVFYYNEGYSPEMLGEQFPTLTLALIHKCIGFYLDNREEVDAYAENCARKIERSAVASKKGPTLAELQRRMEMRKRIDAKKNAGVA